MKCYCYLVLLVFVLTMQSCSKHSDKVDFDKLINKYSKSKSDSLRLEAIIFIRNNIGGISSEKIEFYDDLGRVVDFKLDTIVSDKSLIASMEAEKLNSRSTFVPDTKVLTNLLLESNINHAIDNWHKYPWSRHIPKQIFFNYILPYKVFGENPEDWRSYFSTKYADSIALFTKEKRNDVEGVYRSILYAPKSWFKYDEYSGILGNPSLSDLIRVKKGECFRMSHANVYTLRALGIPATIDIVPFWGDKSGSHATDVFYRKVKNKTDKFEMQPMIGNGLVRPPKVFRYSFKRANLWTDSIMPILDPKNKFLLNFLKTDHLLDVTGEYTPTKNLKYHFETIVDQKLAYICVYNYGKWKPLFYGKINKEDSSAVFNNMGRDLLYHVGVQESNTFRLVGKPFLLDSLGKMVYSNPNYQKKQELNLKKINIGTESWVKKGRRYELRLLDKDGREKVVGATLCKKDSIINFHAIASDAFYILTDKSEKKTSLSRYFLFRNGIQVWH